MIELEADPTARPRAHHYSIVRRWHGEGRYERAREANQGNGRARSWVSMTPLSQEIGVCSTQMEGTS